MSEVTCARCGRRGEGLGAPPLPGALGAAVLAHTCSECWEAWRLEQVKVINHYGLRPHVKEDRERLYGITREALRLPPE